MRELFSWWNLIFQVPLLLSMLLWIRDATARVGNRKARNGAFPYEGASLDQTTTEDSFFAGSSDTDRLWNEEQEDAESVQTSFDIFLRFLGSPRILFTRTVRILLFFWGTTGFFSNYLFSRIFSEPLLYCWISIVAALVLSVFLTRMVNELHFRRMRATATRTRHSGLIGCEGQAIYTVTLETGMAQICDYRGGLHRVNCRIEPDASFIQEGDGVLVVGYDREENRYLVKRNLL